MAQASPNHWAKRGDHEVIDWPNMRNNGMTRGLDGLWPVRSNRCDRPNGPHMEKVWHIIETNIPPEFIDRVLSVGVGNPVTVTIGGRELTHSDATNLWSAWFLSQQIEEPSRIVEIGGGFGCLAGQLKRVWPKADYLLVDLPQSLELQQYYLRQQGIKAEYAEQPSGSADLVICIRAMMEMTLDEIRRYLEWIGTQDCYFYCVSKSKVNGVPMEKYPWPKEWRKIKHNPLPVQTGMHEMLWHT